MRDVTIIVPVINETESLRETVYTLVLENIDDLAEILLVTAPITTAESMAVTYELFAQYPQHIRLMKQKLPYLGGAMRDAFDAVVGDYTLMMSSDLETDPHTVKEMIATMRRTGVDIVTTTRWVAVGGFSGYNPAKLILNFLFQRFFSLLYRTGLTDMTFGFRLYKTSIIRRIIWTELKHPFLLESLLKPLCLGATFIEIPSSWKARSEGVSQNSFLATFLYVRTAFKIFFTPVRRFVK